ncbi:hypothetical protein N2152v2_004798 [Parachlorella kessleri]
MSTLEESVKRLQSHKGVEGILVINGDGVPIRSTLEHELSVQYAALVTELGQKARSVVKELAKDPADDMLSLRIRSKKHELIIVPDLERQFTLVVVQDPSTE